MSEPLRLTIVYEPDEEARENVIGALRELARGPVRFAARAARRHRQRLDRADGCGLKSMTGESRTVAEKR